MKIAIPLLSLLFYVSLLQAQITGMVYTVEGAPISYANVILMQANDSTIVKGTLTDEVGAFKIENIEMGNYLLQLSFVGFQNWYSPNFSISAAEQEKNFGDLTLVSNAIQLEELEVKAKKMLFQQNKEGMVINVQHSLLTQGSSALQVLERLPGVYIDQRNGDIMMNGQNGIRLMINGKTLRLSVADAITMLNGMSAANIENIELLTTPGAKYESEGGAGLINIVLKKDDTQGTNGFLSLTAGYGWKEKAAASLQLNHQQSKTNVYSAYSFSHDNTHQDWQAQGSESVPILGGDLKFDVDADDNSNIQSHNINLGIDQEINETTSVGGSVNFIQSLNRPDRLNRTIYNIVPDSFLNIAINIHGRNKVKNMISTVYMEKQFSDKSQLNIDADYIFYNNQNLLSINSDYSDELGNRINPEGGIYAREHQGDSETNIQVGVLRMDYEKEWSEKLHLEMGWKAAFSNTTSYGTTQRYEANQWVSDNRFANSNDLEEKIGAIYTSLDYQIDSSMQLTLGARFEYWDRQFSRADIKDRKLGQLFPSLFLSKRWSDFSQLKLTYNKRITRPDFNDLAAYTSYNGPISVFTGNPLLQPTITNNLSLAYQFKSYHFSISLNHIDNPIARFQTTQNATNDLVIIGPQNVDYERRLVLQTNVNQEVNKWWTMNVGLSASWRHFSINHTKQAVDKTYFAINLGGSQRFQLPQQFSMELSGWYNTPFYNGSTALKGFGMLNMGIKKQLKNNHGSIQFSITDLFKSMNVVSELGSLTEEAFSLRAMVDYYAESARSRIFRLSYTRSFGNKKIKRKAKREQGASEEKDRVIQD